MSSGRPCGCGPACRLLVLDISVPRNVYPEAADLDGIYLFSVDDLDKIVQASRERRQAESVEAEKLLQLALDRLLKEESRSRSGPAIAAIRNEVHSVCRDELERFEQRVPALSSDQKAEIEMMLYRIAQKIVHPAIMELKKAEQRESSFVERVFGVKEHWGSRQRAVSNLLARLSQRECGAGCLHHKDAMWVSDFTRHGAFRQNRALSEDLDHAVIVLKKAQHGKSVCVPVCALTPHSQFYRVLRGCTGLPERP